jgi:sirohydrochlorin ferrochelatase
VVLVAHGSADPRAAQTTSALAAAVAAARPGLEVRPAFLDHAGPRPGEVLAAIGRAGHQGVAVVPLLLTSAYHGRVDLPAVLAAARATGVAPPVRLTEVLGPVGPAVPAPLVAGLRRRLAEALRRRAAPARSTLARRPYDAVVLAAAGTRDPAARMGVDRVAAALGDALGVPCLAGYASAPAPARTVTGAVAALRGRGARRVAAAAYFLATGRLYAAAGSAASAAGAVAVGRPLGDAAEVVDLVLARLAAGSGGTNGYAPEASLRGVPVGLCRDVRMSGRGAGCRHGA